MIWLQVGVARPNLDADRLARVTAAWLTDPRPAWETVDAFERDVERVLRGGPVRENPPMGIPRRRSKALS